MKWIGWKNVNDYLPENLTDVKVDVNFFGDECIECLVYTNFGNFITKRIHTVKNEVIEYEPNVIGSRKKDYGWCWEIEIGNDIKDNPIWVKYWTLIPEVEI